MPFTFAHPALVLPLSKIRSGYISVSCLVAGSIAPDFEYFFRLKATGSYSHSLEGAFLFCFPVSVFLVLLFHSLIKQPLIDCLPGYFRNRLSALRDVNFLLNVRKYSAGYSLCLLLGIFSHIFWDSFTHAGAFFVNQFSGLTKQVVFPGLPELPVYRYVQHISTLAGLGVISFFFHQQPVRVVRSSPDRWMYWTLAAGTVILVTLIRWSMGFEYFADVGATVLGSALAGITIASLVIAIRQRKSNLS